jgi:hypothetical protein
MNRIDYTDKNVKVDDAEDSSSSSHNSLEKLNSSNNENSQYNEDIHNVESDILQRKIK